MEFLRETKTKIDPPDFHSYVDNLFTPEERMSCKLTNISNVPDDKWMADYLLFMFLRANPNFLVHVQHKIVVPNHLLPPRYIHVVRCLLF